MSIQAIVDAMNRAAESQRSGYHMTLGKLIDELEPHADRDLVVPLSHPHSYRGHYSDLAFERGETPIREFVERIKKAHGETFEGYKGRDFTMKDQTPLWVASYGSCGDALMGVTVTGTTVELETKCVD